MADQIPTVFDEQTARRLIRRMMLDEKMSTPPARKPKRYWGGAGSGERLQANSYLAWTISTLPKRLGRDAQFRECPADQGGFGNTIDFVRTSLSEFGGNYGLVSLASWGKDGNEWALTAKREADNPLTPEDDTELIHAVNGESVDIPACRWVILEVAGTIEPGYRVDNPTQPPPLAFLADDYDWLWAMDTFKDDTPQALFHDGPLTPGQPPEPIGWKDAGPCQGGSSG